jgi:hypothetical protein
VEPSAPPSKDKLLALLRELEQILAKDGPGLQRDRLGEVNVILTRVEHVLQQHAADSEAFDGLFATVDGTRASLGHRVNALYRRCFDLLVQVGDLQREVRAASAEPGAEANGNDSELGDLRQHLNAFLAALQKHRQEEMDLVLESVTTDIGAGD